jgi:putative phosphoesterase
MIIGILSDSHGRQDRVRKALRLFDELGVVHVIHCGDVGGMKVLDELIGRPCHLVWGNMDGPDRGMLAYLQTTGLPMPGPAPTRLELAGKSIAVFHGHEPEFRAALADPDADYILHGHTHVARDERVGRARVINPGALQRASQYTVATLDLATDVVAFYELS